MVYGLLLFVCYVPLVELVLPRVPFLDVNLINFLFLALVLAFVLYSAMMKSFTIFSKWLLFMFIYSIVIVLSVAWSPRYSYDMRVFKDLFSSVFIPLTIAVIAFNVFRTDKSNLTKFVSGMYLAAVMISAVTLFQLLTGRADYEGYRAAGSLGNANGTAIFLNLMLPFMFWGVENKLVSRKFGLAAFLITVGGVLATISRKGMVSLVMLTFIYLFLSKRYSALVSAFLFFVIIGSALFTIPEVYNRFESREIQSELAGRGGMVSAGWDMFVGHPVKGLGYKGFHENIMRYRPVFATEKIDAHNNYITALANYGLLGFVPLLGVLLFPLLDAYRRRQYAGTSVAYLASALPFLFSAYFAGALFYNFTIMTLYYTLSAAVVAEIQA